jgi:hypothetical protein
MDKRMGSLGIGLNEGGTIHKDDHKRSVISPEKQTKWPDTNANSRFLGKM